MVIIIAIYLLQYIFPTYVHHKGESNKIESYLYYYFTDYALICKECNMNCEEPLDELCLDPGESQEVACLTEKFKGLLLLLNMKRFFNILVVDAHNRTFFQRKCVLYEKNTKFECPDYPQYTSLSCVTCKTDRCNVPTPAAPGGKILVNVSYSNFSRNQKP